MQIPRGKKSAEKLQNMIKSLETKQATMARDLSLARFKAMFFVGIIMFAVFKLLHS